jgi:hypothetical protein
MSSSPGWDEGNSGLELIEADEPGGATDAAPGASDSIGPIDSRCLENSCNTLPHSGLDTLSFQLNLELDAV